MSFPTASEIISKEIRESLERKKKAVVDAEKKLATAKEELAKAERQLQCDINNAHKFVDEGGFTRLVERCENCDWHHEV